MKLKRIAGLLATTSLILSACNIGGTSTDSTTSSAEAGNGQSTKAVTLRIAELGSYTKTAKELGLFQSTISRRIVKLEEKLNLKLIVRSSKQFELTKNGKQIVKQLSNMEQLIESKINNALEREDILMGELKVMLPQSLNPGSYDSPVLLVLESVPTYFKNYSTRPNKIFLFFKFEPFTAHQIEINFYHRVVFNQATTPLGKDKYTYLFGLGYLDDVNDILRNLFTDAGYYHFTNDVILFEPKLMEKIHMGSTGFEIGYRKYEVNNGDSGGPILTTENFSIENDNRMDSDYTRDYYIRGVISGGWNSYSFLFRLDKKYGKYSFSMIDDRVVMNLKRWGCIP